MYDLKSFDKVTEFRLINLFLVTFGISLIAPILVYLKGVYLLPWIISMFLIFSTLSVKMNKLLVKKFNLDKLFKIGIFVHLLYIIFTSLYFVNPKIMIILVSSLSIIEVAVFSSYSISLNNYLVDNFPKSMNIFQVTRNSLAADGAILGSILAMAITMFSVKIGVISYLVYNIFFSFWMLYNWNFYTSENFEN